MLIPSIVAALLLSIPPAPVHPVTTGDSGTLHAAPHRSISEQLFEQLWGGYFVVLHGMESAEPGSIHRGEEAIDDALHALQEQTPALRDTRRTQADELLYDCLETVDALHDVANSEDWSALSEIVLHLKRLFQQLELIFEESNSAVVTA